MYGPTETTIWSSTELVTSAQKISLGLPIANTSFHVFTDQQKHVEPGETGRTAHWWNRVGAWLSQA